MPGMTGRIASFANGLEGRDIPSKTRTIAKLAMLDWLVVTMAGVNEPVSGIVRQMVCANGGRPAATVVGAQMRLPAAAAALANGTTSHALDYDDTHWDYVGHPTVAVFPAVFALAEQIEAPGQALVEAFIVGVETACRVGRWLGDSHYSHGFHQTATSGAIGAAAGCARLLGLNAARTSHALSIAATRASGLKSMFGTMGKPYHAGMAASNGVEAAELAALGFVGRDDALECDQGFASTHAGGFVDVEKVLDGLGQTFRFDLVQFKYHACCYGTHAAIEALKAIRQELESRNGARIDLEKIEAIDFRVHPKWLSVCNISEPVTGLEGKFSFRATAGMVLAGFDTADPNAFCETTMADARLVRVRDRVRVIGDEAVQDSAAIVSVLAHGEYVVRTYDLSRETPLDVQSRKLAQKAVSLVGAERSGSISAFLDGLDGMNAVRPEAWLG